MIKQYVSNVVTSKFNYKNTPITNEINESYTTLREDIAKKSHLLLNDKTVKFDVQGQAKSLNRLPVNLEVKKTEDLRNFENHDLNVVKTYRNKGATAGLTFDYLTNYSLLPLPKQQPTSSHFQFDNIETNLIKKAYEQR
jgi:hypothetical protein